MGKKKVGEYYGKSIIVGDENLKTENEIHVDELSKISGEGGSGDNVKYFAIGMDNIVASDFAPENLQTIFQYEEGMTFADWLVSDYNTTFQPDSTNGYLAFIGGASAILMNNGFTREVSHSEVIQSTVYMLYGDY